MRLLLIALALCAAACGRRSPPAPPSPDDPTPQSLAEFQTAATRILSETGIPGAGLALVSQEGIEWAGGMGYADRDLKTPMKADTHFRVGSISKTFVAMALAQMYYDDEIDLQAPVAEIAPEIAIDNPWHDTDPVRVIHLLQHTAGFDDMHFNESYVLDHGDAPSLADALARNPSSRRARWRPGTRMAYSNPGYGVAGYLIEKVSGEPYEDYIKRKIFEPLGMTTSSFRLTPEDERLLARGYSDPTGPPSSFPRIYMTPAGNLHTSPRELAIFVRMILGWGELGSAFVIDPEYLGNMEQPRTTLASAAGLRNGYGSGIATLLDQPYRMLGHGGGIEGFLSQYAYSPSRDVGFLVLLNSTGGRSQEALNRLSSLAVRYLKRDVEPPQKPTATIDGATLDRYIGYYHDASPRNQIMWAVQSLLAGRTISRVGNELVEGGAVGRRRIRLIPVTETTFRREEELDASRVFTQDENGAMVMTGAGLWAVRQPRWRAELLRLTVAAALAVVAFVFVLFVVWMIRVRRARPAGFWTLKLALLLCPVALIVPALTLMSTPMRAWGLRNVATISTFVASIAVPALAAVVGLLALVAYRRKASRWLTSYALAVVLAMTGLSLYLGSHGLIGLRLWRY